MRPLKGGLVIFGHILKQQSSKLLLLCSTKNILLKRVRYFCFEPIWVEEARSEQKTRIQSSSTNKNWLS
jgi:hypothetical protein